MISYIEEYKRIFNVKEVVKRDLNRKEKIQIATYIIIYIVIGIIGWSAGMGVVFKLNNSSVLAFITIDVIFVLMAIGICTKKFDRYIAKCKNRIAINKFQKETWDEVIELKEEKFKLLLEQKGIKSTKQYRMIVDCVEEEIKQRRPKEIIGLGVIGVFILPIWNEMIKCIFSGLGSGAAITVTILMCIPIVVLGHSIYQIRKVVYMVKQFDKIYLEEMKNTLIEWEIENLQA